MKHIEPEIQEVILDVLPDDGPLALKLMAQLSANMLLSIDGADLGLFIKDVQDNLAEYKKRNLKANSDLAQN